jgi:hypothetical protein
LPSSKGNITKRMILSRDSSNEPKNN